MLLWKANNQRSVKWNQPDGPTGVYPVNPPALRDDETLIRDEPRRCGGLDSHSHHYRLAKGGMGHYTLIVRHGAGDERVPLFKPEAEALIQLESTPCYWLMNAIMHANGDGKRNAREATDLQWRKAAAEKRIKTRKVRNGAGVKVWIEPQAA